MLRPSKARRRKWFNGIILYYCIMDFLSFQVSLLQTHQETQNYDFFMTNYHDYYSQKQCTFFPNFSLKPHCTRAFVKGLTGCRIRTSCICIRCHNPNERLTAVTFRETIKYFRHQEKEKTYRSISYFLLVMYSGMQKSGSGWVRGLLFGFRSGSGINISSGMSPLGFRSFGFF